MAWLGKFLNSSHDERQFTVYINEGEKYQIEKWVERYPNIETGGDLFGAWIDDRTAVVQFVLGPGKYCRRTSVSFFQDIDYLREAGNYLTQKHGLCNIGQWHSHHKLGLTRPSGGDENTVWGNMPNLGLDRYIVFIATITGGSYFREEKLTVNINPYLFEIKDGRKNGVLHGSFQSMERNSPFRLDKGIEKKVEFGAESMNDIKKYRKRPRENESVEETTKTPKMKTEAVQHHSAQSLPPNTGENFDNDNKGVSKEDEESRQSNFQQGDGTDRNLENVSNEDEESGQSGSQQGDGGTERNLEDVPNEKKENQTDMVGDRSLTSDEETENEQDSSQNNLAKGGNLYNPNNDKDHAITDDNKLAGDSQSKQSSASNGDGSDSYQQEGDWNKKSEPTTPTTDEDECKEKQTELMDVDNKQLLTSGIQKDDEEDSSTNNSVAQDSKNNNDNKGQVKTDNGTAFAGEGSLDGRSEQSNIPKVDGTGSNLQETSQKSTVENFDKHDSDKDQLQSDAALLGDVLRDEQPNVSQKDTASGLRGDLNENSTPATSQEDENEKQIHIMDVDSHQRSTTDTHEEHEQDPQKDAASNLTGDSNENSKHATSTLQEDENDTQEEHEQDPSQKKPAGKDVSDHDEKDQIKVDNGYQDGQRGEPDIPQKDAESDLKQSLNEDSPNNSLTNESKDFNKTTTVSEDVKGRAANDHANDKDITSEHDGELDGANNADEEMRSESEEGRNATESGNVTTENSGLEGRHDKLDEKEENQIALDDGEIGGPECCDEIVPSEGDVTERSNIIEDMEDQDPNVILHASKPADGPDETQVESMEVDNQNFSSEVATDVAVKVEKMVVDSEHLSSGNSETNVDSITLEEVLFDDGIQVKGTETEIAFLRNTEEDGCMKKDERATSKDKMGGSGAVEDFSEPLTKSEGDTVTSISVDHEDGGQERAIENLDIASEQNIIKTVKDGEHLECGIETNTSASLDDDDAGREQVTNNLAIESDQLIAKAVRDGESFEDGIDDQHNELEHNSENLLTSGKTGDHKLMNELAGDTLSDKTAFLDTANEAMDDSNTNQETEDTVKGRKKEEIADVSNNDPTHDKSLDKRNSRRSRSIFDRPPEYEKQELTSNDEESEADKKVGTEARAHAFTEKETKNEEKESQDNKQDLSEGESEKNEFDMTTAFESIDSVIGKNSKNVNENLNDGPSASEVNEDKEEAVDIQDQMELIETVSDEVIESKSKGDKKQKKKESTEDEVGDQDNGKRKSKDTIQTDHENTEENPVDLSKNGEECVTCFGSIRKRFKHGEKSKKGKERGKEINRKGKEKGKKKGNKEGEEERNE